MKEGRRTLAALGPPPSSALQRQFINKNGAELIRRREGGGGGGSLQTTPLKLLFRNDDDVGCFLSTGIQLFPLLLPKESERELLPTRPDQSSAPGRISFLMICPKKAKQSLFIKFVLRSTHGDSV